MAAGSNVTRAAKAARISYFETLRWRKKDAAFRSRFEDAVTEGIELLEAAAIRRAYEGGVDQCEVPARRLSSNGRRGAAKAEELVFQTRSGKPLDRGRVRVILRRAAQRAGVTDSVSPHWLRHAHASHALDHGAPIHLVQATLGHASVATTGRYLHARPTDSSARYTAG